MPNSKQIHIFATRTDLEPGLIHLESEVAVKYVRCDLYYGATFEQHVSLLAWDDLGKNATGDHMTGAQFLVVRRSYQIKVLDVPQGRSQQNVHIPSMKNALMVGEEGKISKIQKPFSQHLDDLERKDVRQSKISVDSRMLGKTRYDVSQLANPDSIAFLPGGIFDNQEVLVCGHIGTASKSPDSLTLYKVFVKSVTKGFVKIGSYRIGRQAKRLMDQGYRMVTIGVGSPREYDLRTQ